MEKIERHAYDDDDKSGIVYMDAYESRALSKWNHADIIALADAGERLLAAASHVRTFVVIEPDSSFWVHRATEYVIALLHVGRSLFGADVSSEMDAFIRRHAEFSESFVAEVEAKKEALARYQVSTAGERGP